MNEWLPKFKSERLLDQIRICTSGLNYISETDAAIEPYFREGAEGVDVSNFIAKETGGQEYEKIDTTRFFERLTTVSDRSTSRENETARRFAALRNLLEENLRDVTAIKVGHIRLDIYVVGLDADNNVVGIKTKAVET